MTGEPRRGSTMRGIVGGSTEGTITTGGFSYDEATLEGLITEWLALSDDYDRSFRDSQDLVRVVGPGLDFASRSVAKAAASYGRNYLLYLRQNRDYCIEQAQLCQNALDDYLGLERRNVAEIHRAGEPDNDERSGQEI
ncbi:hypothetical protein [Actinophytocola sp. NPDC049390]|uniref:hypothetical protein n=1 Tax=Actinophytocola sp. NPDC049390 TaxID=3363894 RepID=UPI00378AECFC